MPGTTITTEQRLKLLAPPAGKIRMVLDTDTYNEIDDQFALAYAMLSPEQLEVEAIYAAPFHNKRSNGPEDGMLKSYDEILRVLGRLGRSGDGFVYKGATAWLDSAKAPATNAAVEDLIARATSGDQRPLYVVAIGAITNIAMAIRAAPKIIDRIVVVWLGGNPEYWHHTREFNLMQDVGAARLVFDSGVPLVHVPCINVTEHLRTTQAELERFIRGSGPMGEYLFQIFSDYRSDHFARSKELWDLGPVAWLVNPAWVDSALIHSPILSNDQTWSHDPRRHFIREVYGFKRDPIFADLFRKLGR